MGGVSGDGKAVPWASLFDPVANARAFGDIPAQALRAAGELVERLAASTDDSSARATSSDNQGSAGDADSPLSDASRLIDAWVEMLQRVATSFAPGSDGDASDQRVEIDVNGGAPARCLRLVVDESGAARSSVTEAWLHNGAETSVGPLTLRVGDLRSPDGELLAAALACDPAFIEALPARSSRGIRLSVAKDGALQEGVYRGIIQVEGTPNVWLPVEVVASSAS